jgi:hypothetical protein
MSVSIQQILMGLIDACRGGVAGMYQVGVGSSNAPHDVTSAEPVDFLNVKLRDVSPAGCDGMATVHVFANEVELPVQPPDANQKVVVRARWQSSLGGGDIEFDGAHGMYLRLGANTSVHLQARLASSIDGVPLIIGSTYRMEAVVKWFTSVGNVPALLALPSLLISADTGFSDWFKIPRQARTVQGMYFDPNAGLGNTIIQLATVPNPAAIKYTTNSDWIRPAPIVNGVEWLRFFSQVSTLAFPTFELHA